MSAESSRKNRCAAAVDSLLRFIHRKDPDALMEQLKHRFPETPGILEAGAYDLRRTGLNDSEAQLLSLIPDLARYAVSREFGPHPMLPTLSAASEYLKTRFIGVQVEQFHLLCLDSNGRMIQCALLQEGTTDETPFYLAKLLETVITSNAHAIVLSHNHPGGTLRPSNADIHCTLGALQALSPLHIPLLDHVIVAAGQTVSFRQIGCLESSLWLQQNPRTPLLLNWVDAEF